MTLAACPLFSGLSFEEIRALLPCLKARERQFAREAMVMSAGELTHDVGIVLSGRLMAVQDDYWGHRSVMTSLSPFACFAEAFAVSGEPLTVSVVALEPSTVLFVDAQSLLHPCETACQHHRLLTDNMLRLMAQNNIALTRRISQLSRRGLRDKLISHLSFESRRQGTNRLHLDYSRQTLADMLAVDRSALSRELSHMQQDGLVVIQGRDILLKKQVND